MIQEALKGVRMRRRRGEDATRWYDDLVRRRVTLLGCHCGGPALEVGAGPCVCMAQRLARCGMRVTAVDEDAGAISSAAAAAASPELKGRVEVQLADACHLPFEDGSYRVVVAFDCLGHAKDPTGILAEMFRVCSEDGIVLITEYNRRGRRATHHTNFGFENRLAGMIEAHCEGCRRIEHPHHVTYVCDANTRSAGASRGADLEGIEKAVAN